MWHDPASAAALTVLLRHNVQQFGRKPVAKRLQSVRQFVLVDGSGSILVKVTEDALPILDVLPEACEFVEADLSAPVHVEYAH